MELYWQNLIIGLVQGLTEFLPISSTLHIHIVGNIINYKENHVALDIILHLSTLLVLLFYFRAMIINTLYNLFFKRQTDPIIYKLFISILPLIIFVTILPHPNFPKETFFLFLILGGVVLIYTWRKINFQSTDTNNFILISKITYKHAIIIGCAQLLAIVPGVSRSGATIVAGVLSGLNIRQSFTYSFLLSIPTIIASTCYSLIKDPEFFTNHISISYNGLVLFGSAVISSLFTFPLIRNLFFYNYKFLLFLGIYRIFLGSSCLISNFL